MTKTTAFLLFLHLCRLLDCQALPFYASYPNIELKSKIFTIFTPSQPAIETFLPQSPAFFSILALKGLLHSQSLAELYYSILLRAL